MSQVHTYNPETWLESTLRALEEYVGDRLNSAVQVSGNPVGLYDPNTNPGGPFQLIMEFPNDDQMRQKVPLVRSMVHMELDSIDSKVVGFGRRIVRENYDFVSQTHSPQEAGWHELNFDVGIWTSDRSGGTTSRMRLYQILDNAFRGVLAQEALDDAVSVDDGRIEILRFTGGRFITETINDVITYRSVDGTLEVRVFSRTPLSASAAPTIEEIVQSPGLTIVE